MHKKLLLLTTTLVVSNIALANNPKVKLTGGLDFKSIFYHHDAKSSDISLTAQNKNFGFNNSANVAADISNKTDSGFVYGAKISLLTNTVNNRSSSSSIYFTTDYGKMELGSDKSATAKMKISSMSNAAATKGEMDSILKSDPRKTGTKYITSWSNFLDAKTRPSGKSEYSRKITYYTPEFSGFQFGISYIPDSFNCGNKRFYTPPATRKASDREYKVYFTDGIATGLTYKNKFSDDLNFKSAFVFEKANTISDPQNPTKQTFSNLKNITIGAEITYKRFSIAAAFGDYLKSCTNNIQNPNNKNTYLYGLTGKYSFLSDISMSIGYFGSNHCGNKFSSVTLATDYKIAPGIMPYAEISFYNGKGKNLKNISDSTSGNILIIGAKFQF